MKTFTLLKSLLVVCLISLLGGSAWAQETVTDVITISKLKVSGNTYTPFSDVKLESGAVYAGQASNNSGIQLNDSKKNSHNIGIVSTSSIGKIIKVSVTFASGATKDRILNIYGKNTPYASNADELFSSSTKEQGTLIGSATVDKSNLTVEIPIDGDYQYIGFRTKKSAIVISSISITWQKPVTGTFSITSAGYATYFTDKAFTMPDGVTGSIITDANGGSLTIEDKYPAGSVVPASTALLLKGAEKEYTYNVVTTTETAPTNNLLHGSVSKELTSVDENTDDYLFYKLSYDENNENLGFYWAEANGAYFLTEGGKAYLAVPKTKGASQMKGFALDGTTTSIQQANAASAENASIYDINGRRVSTLTGAAKGVYIVGGKKVMVK